ncbi:hypothetical protein ABT282_08775 [Streptomyces sp. NPDC000927]|uniref:hypothetical protein n=1 Tax=Streptomyces sp. NPDC000927 TaxID=3154371 RepID=UPI003331EA1A
MDRYFDAMRQNKVAVEAMKMELAEYNLSLAESVSMKSDGSLDLHYPESALGPAVVKAGDLGPLEESLGAVIDIAPIGADQAAPVTIDKVSKDSGLVRIDTVELAYPILVPEEEEVRFIRDL